MADLRTQLAGREDQEDQEQQLRVSRVFEGSVGDAVPPPRGPRPLPLSLPSVDGSLTADRLTAVLALPLGRQEQQQQVEEAGKRAMMAEEEMRHLK